MGVSLINSIHSSNLRKSNSLKPMRKSGSSENAGHETIFAEIEKYDKEYLSFIRSHDFNIHAFTRASKRSKSMKMIATKILMDADFKKGFFTEVPMGHFLSKISKIYKMKIEYHNDLHGADVMQMIYHMMTECNMRNILKLNDIDCLSFLMASLCHDLGHDGYTNSYHTNAVTRRAIDSNDISIQEFFHVSEMFRILSQDRYNFA